MKRSRIAKTMVIFIACIIALAMSGATYALWSEELHLDIDIQTGEVDWEFWHPSWYITPGVPEFPLFIHGDTGIDPGWTKDVGSNWANFFDADGDGDFDTMHLVFENVYPYYQDHFAFAVHCNGDIPIHIWKVEFTNLDGSIIYETIYENGNIFLDIGGPDGDDIPDGEADIFIWWGDNFGTQMHYCDSVDISFNVNILQPCPQGANLQFLINVVSCQYNEYVQGPIDGY
jgi:hypothetical protein